MYIHIIYSYIYSICSVSPIGIIIPNEGNGDDPLTFCRLEPQIFQRFFVALQVTHFRGFTKWGIPKSGSILVGKLGGAPEPQFFSKLEIDRNVVETGW
jgi:hypothetical protein